MRIFSVELAANAQNLLDLLGIERPHAMSGIGFQTPEGNSSTAYIGTQKQQPLELKPDRSVFFPATTVRDIFVRGTSPDKLTVALF